MILLSFQKLFLEFFTSTSILFFHTNLSFQLIYSSARILVVREFTFMIKRSDHKCSTFVFGGVVEVAVSASLWVRVLFLREKVKDLRVQEFLRELIVGVAAPSDLQGSL